MPDSDSESKVGSAISAGGTSAGVQIERSEDSTKAERRAARDAYVTECSRQGVIVTDEMIGEAANPRWRSRHSRRSAVQKWMGLDKRYDGAADRMIRSVFERKPHLHKK